MDDNVGIVERKMIEMVKGPHKVAGKMYRGRCVHVAVGVHTFLLVAPDNETLLYGYSHLAPDAAELDMANVKDVMVGSAAATEKVSE